VYLRGEALEGPTMRDEHESSYASYSYAEATLRRIVNLKIARNLRAVYNEEMQVTPELQAFLQQLDEQQEQDQ
jgi:hypothetical protein